MLLTRFVRNQLIIFTIASIVGVAVMVFTYMQVPALLGIGHIKVTLELPAAGGLYRFSNVTYRGVQIGEVREVKLTEKGAEAEMTLDTSPKIPADLQAEVRSVSAVGEQYVDLRPRTDSGPYLEDGSVIAMDNATIPQQVGPMLDQVSALVDSIPENRISDLLDESFKAFNGAGDDFQSLLDSSANITDYLNDVSDQSRALIDDSGPLLESQAETTDAIRTWARSLAGVTEELAQNDPELRTILQRGPGFAQEVSALLTQIKPTLPILLANLTTLGQILVTYNPSLEQLLVLLPGVIGGSAVIWASEEQPNGAAPERLLVHYRRSPRMYGRLPASVAVAQPRRHHHDRHTGRAVLQTAARFADLGARRTQLSVHGASWKARSHGRTLQRPKGFCANRNSPTHARA